MVDWELVLLRDLLSILTFPNKGRRDWYFARKGEGACPLPFTKGERIDLFDVYGGRSRWEVWRISEYGTFFNLDPEFVG